MFAYPLLPSLPASLQPAALDAPIRSFLSLPKNIDYDSIASLPETTNGKPVASTHSGPLADLSPEICPICHLRSATSPVPLAAGVSLPPVTNGDEDEENQVFVPAQTDCWGGCRWCYYCIMSELATLDSVQNTRSKGKETETGDAVAKWDCLRCGGAVTKAWRVGTEVEPIPDVTDDASGVLPDRDVDIAP